MKNITRQVQSSPGFAQFPLQRQFKGPKMAAPPAPIPPVSVSASEVADASRQQKMDAAKRKGYSNTLLAGNAGIGMGDQTGGAKTLLGG